MSERPAPALWHFRMEDRAPPRSKSGQVFSRNALKAIQSSGLFAIDSVRTTMLRRNLLLGSFAKAFNICTA
jgi:hypothetical protein